VLCLGLANVAKARDLTIHDQDVVAFLGDSNTSSNIYPRYVNQYLKDHHPELHLNIVNAGVGGDTAEMAYHRLARDIFSKNVNVVFVLFGINDIKWGGDLSLETRARFLESIRSIVLACQAHNIRVVVLSYTLTQDPLAGISSNLNV